MAFAGVFKDIKQESFFVVREVEIEEISRVVMPWDVNYIEGGVI